MTLATVVRSEWIKFRTLRSSWLVVGTTTLGVVGISALVSHFTKTHFADMHPDELAGFDPINTVLTGVNFAQLTVGILGVLFVTGEYGTGMIRATLAAVPTRVPVLVAKSVVYAAVAFVSSLMATVVAFAVGGPLLSPHNAGWSDPGVVRGVVGAALYLTVVALAGIAIGFIVRSTAGGIGTLFGVLLILPVIFRALPASWNTTVGPYLPSTAGQALYQMKADHAVLSTLGGLRRVLRVDGRRSRGRCGRAPAPGRLREECGQVCRSYRRRISLRRLDASNNTTATGTTHQAGSPARWISQVSTSATTTPTATRQSSPTTKS